MHETKIQTNKVVLIFISWLLLVIITITNPAPVSAHDTKVTAEETKLRAAIVLGILRFSSWPNDVNMASAFNLCTLGQPISSDTLIKISGQRVHQGKPILTIILKVNAPDISNCNAIVIGAEVSRRVLSKLLSSKKAFGILTICDNCQTEHTRAMVFMLRKKNRVGFEIDLIQAQKNGMTFSSSLLELAIDVRQD